MDGIYIEVNVLAMLEQLDLSVLATAETAYNHGIGVLVDGVGARLLHQFRCQWPHKLIASRRISDCQ